MRRGRSGRGGEIGEGPGWQTGELRGRERGLEPGEVEGEGTVRAGWGRGGRNGTMRPTKQQVVDR